jgi:hypothetical protein
MGADKGPKSVNRCGPVGVLLSKFHSDTLDGGNKGWSRSCVVVSVVSGWFAFLSSTASVNLNFADVKKELADAKKERALQNLYRRRDRLERQRDRLETAGQLQIILNKLNEPEKQAMKPQGETQQVDYAPISPPVDCKIESEIKEIEKINSEIEEKELEMKRIDGSKGEDEVGSYQQQTD